MTIDDDLQSKEEIRTLLARYNNDVDARDPAWVDHFTAQGVLEAPGRTAQGRAELEAFLASLGAPGHGIVRHFAVNEVIEVDGDNASMRCAFLVRIKRRDGTEMLGSGTYDDLLERTDGRWRFVRRSALAD